MSLKGGARTLSCGILRDPGSRIYNPSSAISAFKGLVGPARQIASTHGMIHGFTARMKSSHNGGR